MNRDSIPIDDPDAALSFCRKLKHALESPDGSSQMASPPEVSVVIPVYNESAILTELFARLEELLGGLGVTFEILFVDDGSNDKSADIISEFIKQEPRAKLIRLSRNFGQQAAFSAGLDLAQGKAVILMDADLQDDPTAVKTFIEKWREGFDVVFAIRKDRKERTSKRMAYTLFYKLLSFLADSPIQRDAGDFCLLDQKVVREFRNMPEYHRFLRGMRSWLGFRQIGIPVERHARYAGAPKYTLRKLMKLAMDGFTTSSILPLRAITLVGFLLALVSVVMAGVYAYIRLTSSGFGPPGFATIVVLLCFLSGIQMMLVGVVGEYVGRVFEQVRGRPNYIVEEIITAKKK